MYIKIKHIKQFLLISACLFFAGFNYLAYVRADNTLSTLVIDSDKDGLTDEEEKLYGTDAKNSDSDGDGYSDGVEVESGYDPAKPAPGDRVTPISKVGATNETQASVERVSLTDEIAQELKTYTASNEGKTVTASDLRSFMETKLDSKMGNPLTWETLPVVDSQQIKILNQSYGSLSDIERKAQLQKDASAYLMKISYLIAANFPVSISSEADIKNYAGEFEERFATLSTTNPDMKYFSDLGNRLELFSAQAIVIEVPETMLDMHIKLLRLVGGFLTLREEKSSVQDPMAQSVLMGKVQNLMNLLVDLFRNEFQNYVNQLVSSQK